MINWFVVLLWWWWWYAVDILYSRCTPLYLQWLPLFFVISVLCARVLSSVDYWCQSQMSSLSIHFCAKMVIPFNTIIASEIFCPPSLEKPLPYLSWSIRWARGSAGSYGPIILTAVSLGRFRILPNRN